MLPFLILLSRDVKQNPRTLLGVAGLLMVMRFVDIFWWIEPAYVHDGQYAFWLLDLAALNRAQLEAAGAEAVYDIGICTKEHYLFPSHRRHPDGTRFGAIVALR